MEKILLRMPLGDGTDTHVIAEIDARDLEDTELVAADGKGHLAIAATTPSDAFEKLEPALQLIVSRLRDAARRPDEITVGFGLNIGGETGFVFAKGSVQANLSVSVTWKHEAGQADHAQETV